MGAKAQSLPHTPPDRHFQGGHTPLRLRPRGRHGGPQAHPRREPQRLCAWRKVGMGGRAGWTLQVICRSAPRGLVRSLHRAREGWEGEGHAYWASSRVGCGRGAAGAGPGWRPALNPTPPTTRSARRPATRGTPQRSQWWLARELLLGLRAL